MNDFPEPRRSSSIFFIEVDRIKPNPLQPRTEFDETKLSELAESIRQYGVLQPLVVTRKERETPNGVITDYELIAGERRLKASRLAGLREVPALIRDEPIEKIKLELALVENVQREDLNTIDRAVAFNRLHDEFGLTHKEVGMRIGKSREYVANSVRLLGLPEEIQDALRAGRITESHARYLLMLQNDPQGQKVLLDTIINQGINVREAERISKEMLSNNSDSKKIVDPDTKNIEEKLAQTLGARVNISKSDNGGKISLEFFSPDELNSFIAKFFAAENPAPDLRSDDMPQTQLVSELEEFTI
ncbi:ParB/RepB/Spo0J family partition protein [Candidatus Giovannonibacteria bacterium]|nr:ParB/RepB/Spo0J family partition protein [Candidatus Giovannonibacteria bacterium]